MTTNCVTLQPLYLVKVLIQMFKRLTYGLFSAVILLVAHTVAAAEVTELDMSIVKVADRTTKTKNAALAQALQNVILKNSGRQSALTVPSIVSALNNPTALIRQFGYQETDGQQYLRATFDHQKIIQLLRDARLPVWGTQRPLTLIWLSFQQDGQRIILNDSSTSESRAYIDELAQARGLPVLLPMMDLDDAMNVNVSDVRGFFVDAIAHASARYNTDYFVTASIELNVDNQLHYSMVLYPRTSSEALFNPLVQDTGVVADVDSALNQMFLTISEYYVSQYAVADSGVALSTQLSFIDITERKQLVDIENYLSQLSAVKQVTLTRLQGRSAQFTLQLFGSEEDLKRLLSLESRIKPQSVLMPTPIGGVDPLAPSQSETINYIWLGH